MSRSPRILVAAPTQLGSTMRDWLAEAGYQVTHVATFTEAKQALDTAPDAVLAEIRLGEYNGLHLASRARSFGIPSAVVGDHDPVLERDARHMGVVYLTRDFDRDYLLAVVEQLLAGGNGNPVFLRSHAVAGPVTFLSSREVPSAKITARLRRLANPRRHR